MSELAGTVSPGSLPGAASPTSTTGMVAPVEVRVDDVAFPSDLLYPNSDLFPGA